MRSKTTSPAHAPAAQSPAQRREAQAQLRALVEKVVPSKSKLIADLRRALRKAMPTAHELVYEYRDSLVMSFSPSDAGYEGVVAIRAGADGARLYFGRGKELKDPTKLLQGSGNATRWMSIESAATLRHADVAHLIDQATALGRVPFARSGKGAVLIRSAPIR